MTQPLASVSIIVPTYNRAALLSRCLESLEKLTYPRDLFELIVVDDGSADGTPELLASFARRTALRLRHERQANRGPAAARNLAMQKADGALIAFTDDDCAADPGWLGALVEGFSGPDVVGVGGRVEIDSRRGLIGRFMEAKGLIASRLDGGGAPAFIATANACYRREVLLAIGGFDEALTVPGGEDPDLSWRVRPHGRLVLAPEAIVYHHSKGLREFYLMAYHYGWAHAYLQLKHALPAEARRSVGWRARLLSMASAASQGMRRDGLGLGAALAFVALDRVYDWAFHWGYRRGLKRPGA